MFLSDLNTSDDKKIVKECRQLISELKEDSWLSSHSKNINQQSSKPEDSAKRGHGKVIYPGMTGVVQSAEEHLEKASLIFDKLRDTKKGTFDPEIYSRVMNQLRVLRDKLISYKRGHQE